MFLCYFAFILFLVISSRTLIRSMIDVESFERDRYKSMREKGLNSFLGQATLLAFLISGCFFVAGINAEYKWVWRVFCAILLLIGVICLFVYSFNRITKSNDIEVPALQDETLAKNIRKRKRTWFFQSLVIVFWVYSWKMLYV